MEDKKIATEIGIKISLGLFSAAGVLITANIAILNSLPFKSYSSYLAALSIILSILFLILSIVEGGKGINIIKKHAYYGYYNFGLSKIRFKNQGNYCFYGIIIFVLSLFFSICERQYYGKITEQYRNENPFAPGKYPEIIQRTNSIGVLIGILIITLSIGLIIYSRIQKQKELKNIGSLIGTIGTLFGIGITFAKFDIPEISIFKSVREYSSNISEGANENNAASRLIYLDTICTFEDASDEIKDLSNNDEYLRVKKYLIENKKEISGVILIGRTDIRRLAENPANKYETNFNLGTARAQRIKNILSNDPQLKTLNYLILASGSLYVGDLATNITMKNDRVVEVFIFR